MANFIFYAEKLKQNIKYLKNIFLNKKINFSIFYSVKTNFSEVVINTIKESDANFEIVSSFEWELVRSTNPKVLVLNGPSKSKELIEDIIKSGVEKLFFNIDNDTDFEIIAGLNPDCLGKIKIGIRVYLNKEGIWNRFGFEIGSELLENAIKKLGKSICGFHFHFSTNDFKIENYVLILREIKLIIEKFNLNIEYIDIGGGLPGREEHIYKNNIEKIPAIISELFPNSGILFISEVGRFLVEDVFHLLAEIVSIKRKEDNLSDLTIDTNIMHFPCFWEKKFNLEYISKRNTQKTNGPFFVNIYGNSCMQIDKISERFLINKSPEVGDRILIKNVGAYSLSQASNFITKIPNIITK